jgi:hypothetical protein
MVTRLWLLASLALSSISVAHGTRFAFPGTCVDNCVAATRCGSNDAKCMCLAARGNFLLQIVGCMYRQCGDRLVAVDADFLDIMDRGCAAIRVPIPADKIKSAERAATSFAQMQPPPTQGLPPPPPPPPPVTTQPPNQQPTRQPPPVQTTGRNPPPPDTRSQDEPSPTEEPDLPPTTVTLPPTQTEVVPVNTTPNPPPSEPTDSSPFATPNAAPAYGQVAGWLGVGLPLAAAWGLF